MDKDLESWNAAAEGWDKKIAIDDSYRTLLILDALNKLLPDVKGLKILDAGCGNGYFSNWLKARGADVLGVDGAKEMIEIAKVKYPGVEFQVADLLKSVSLPQNSFDIVLANMLVMHLKNAETFFEDAKKLLKSDGKLIFSVLHPAFNYPTSKLYKSTFDKITFAKVSSLAYDYYSQESGRYESHLGTNLSHYHRTLEEYSSELEKAGFAISRIVEPHSLPKEFLQKNPKLEYAQRLPRFIFFLCQKT
jgi:2-polyprenyl-3-methyl-5-hydroxy-6-metoxy-1,4-benzoquinol methylase